MRLLRACSFEPCDREADRRIWVSSTATKDGLRVAPAMTNSQPGPCRRAVQMPPPGALETAAGWSVPWAYARVSVCGERWGNLARAGIPFRSLLSLPGEG